ncbi:MAG: DEAD/DEAH box helicase [Syntrophobacteraceae bacterium]
MIASFFRNIRNWFRKEESAEKKEAPQKPAMTGKEHRGEARRDRQEPAEASPPGSKSGRRRSRRRQRDNLPTEGKRRGPQGREAPAEPETVKWHLSEFEVPPADGKTRFHDLDLPEPLMHAIADLGFQYCTPIQSAILPDALAGVDAGGRAQTGTGKSAAFLISALTHLLRKPAGESRRNGVPRTLILAPTRELVLQIEKDAKLLGKYCPIRIISVYGGMNYEKQRKMLTEEVIDIVVATPGRLIDFLNRGDIHLNKVEILVIDEADRMLDMGFIPDVQKIVHATPPKARRQTMFFSATLTSQVTRLASQWTNETSFVEIEPEQVAAESVEQIVYITTMGEKFTLLYNLITQQNLERVIVFGNRRDQTRRLMEQLQDYGISCALLSGEVDQGKRIRTLEDFRRGKIRVLVATDVAARGLHVDGVSHVVNYNLPLDPEDYVHRIGRTGRAGASGISVSFASEDDSFQIPDIEKFLGRELHCIHPEDELLTPPGPPAHVTAHAPAPRPRRGPRDSQSGSSRPRRSRRA